jgi:hypothetical protein
MGHLDFLNAWLNCWVFAMSSSKTTNPVFERVLQKHIDLWKSDKRFEFSGPTPTPDDVLKEIESLEKEHEKTRVRRYTARFATVIQGFQGYFSAVDAFVSSDPLIAGLVWGGIKFVIQVFCHGIYASADKLSAA